MGVRNQFWTGRLKQMRMTTITHHLFKVDQPVLKISLVALVGKGHVLEEKRHKGDNGRLHFGDEQSVAAVVARRINECLELGESALEFAWQPFPGLCESCHGHIAQSHDDGEKCIQILQFFAADRWANVLLVVGV